MAIKHIPRNGWKSSLEAEWRDWMISALLSWSIRASDRSSGHLSGRIRVIALNGKLFLLPSPLAVPHLFPMNNYLASLRLHLLLSMLYEPGNLLLWNRPRPGYNQGHDLGVVF